MKLISLIIFIITFFITGCNVDMSGDSSNGISDFSNIDQFVDQEITITGSAGRFTGFLEGEFYKYAVSDRNGYHILFIPPRADQTFNQGDKVIITGILKIKVYGGKEKFYVIEPTGPIQLV